MIIKIEPHDNGGHANQSITPKKIPDGWAVIPDDLKTEHFPFGEVETKEIDGVVTVTKWTPGIVPETAHTAHITETEQLRADVDYIAIMTGVEL